MSQCGWCNIVRKRPKAKGSKLAKVIHVVPEIANEASGPSYSVVRLCESLISQGESVTLCTLNYSQVFQALPFLKRFSIGYGPRRLGRSPAMYTWLNQQAALNSIKLIHNHSLWMLPNVYPAWVVRDHSIPLVISPRGTLSDWAFHSGSMAKRLFWPLLQRPALVATTCFHATAESEFEDIRKMGFKQPVAIIPNGIDIPLNKEKPGQQDCTLLFLGRIHPIKGVNFLLKAWQVVSPRFPQWRLRIVGPDNDGYLNQMMTLATKLRLKRVEFSGVLFGEKKLSAYQQADLFVLPTNSENFGVTVAESLAAGTAAIVAKGAPWAGLKKHEAGWWIDIGTDSLVACLEEAMSLSPASLFEMGQHGRKWMKAEYSWKHIAQKMIATYTWILSGGEKPSWIW